MDLCFLVMTTPAAVYSQNILQNSMIHVYHQLFCIKPRLLFLDVKNKLKYNLILCCKKGALFFYINTVTVDPFQLKSIVYSLVSQCLF